MNQYWLLVQNMPYLAQNGPSKMCQFWHLNLPAQAGEISDEVSFSSTCSTCSLTGQPLLTQKARKGLVNEVTSTCPQVEHMTYQ